MSAGGLQVLFEFKIFKNLPHETEKSECEWGTFESQSTFEYIQMFESIGIQTFLNCSCRVSFYEIYTGPVLLEVYSQGITESR